MLPDEEKTFHDLKDKPERVEFQKIFRRGAIPTSTRPENEYQATYNADSRGSGPPCSAWPGRAARPRTAAGSTSCSASRTR